MSMNILSKTLLLLASTLSVWVCANDAIPEIEGSQIEHTSIYNGHCMRAIHNDIDVTDTCSPVIAIMHLADGRVVVNLEHGDHQTTSLYASPAPGSVTPQQHWLVTKAATGSGVIAVEGKCVLSHHQKARHLTCAATSAEGALVFEFDDVLAVSPEKK